MPAALTAAQAAALKQIAAGQGLNGIRTATLLKLERDGNVKRVLGGVWIATTTGREALAARAAHTYRYGA